MRTVDLTASPIHRLLGLSTVRIGTGSRQRGRRSTSTGSPPAGPARSGHGCCTRSRPLAPAAEEDEPHPGGERVVARFEPGWLRYAPFTSAGLVLTAGVIGVGSQVLDGLGVFDNLDPEAIDRTVTDLGALVALPALVRRRPGHRGRRLGASATSSPTATSPSATPSPTARGTCVAAC